VLGLPQGEAALARGYDDAIRMIQDWILLRPHAWCRRAGF
jgi:hypothetical protein